MAFLAAIPAIMGSMMAEAGVAAGIGSAAAGAAEAGAAFSGIAGASGAAAAGGGGAAAAGGTAAAAAAGGLTAADMAALGLTAAGAASTMLTPTPKIPKPDAAANTPNVMPEEDSDTILKARQRAMVSQQQRQGRASTMLSTNNDALGG